MDTVDVPGGHPSENEVDGGKLCSTEKNLPSDNAIESQAAAGTDTNVMDEKCAQNVVTDPEEQNEKLAPKTNNDSNPAERSQSASDSSTVNEADAEKSTLDYQEAPGEPGPKAGVVCHPSEDAECLTHAGGVANASKDAKDANSGLEKENTDDNNQEVIAGVLNAHKEAKDADSGLEKETSEDNPEVFAGMKEVCDRGTDQKSSMEKKTEKDVIEEDKPLNDLIDAGPLEVEVDPLNDLGESFKPDTVSNTAVNVAITPPQAETLSPPESTDECNLMEGRSDDSKRSVDKEHSPSNDRVEELKVEHPCVSDRRPESVETLSEHSVNSVTQKASVCAVSVALCRKSLSTADEEPCEPFPPGKLPNESNERHVDNSCKETVQQQIANVTYFKCAALGNVNDNVSDKVSGKYSQNPDSEAEHGKDECVSVVEERSCAHIVEDKSINESNDKLEKSSLSSLEEQPKHDQNLKDERPLSTCEDHIDGSNIDVHQPSTDDTGPDDGVLTKLKLPDPEEAAGEPSQDVSLSPLEEQPKGDRNVIEETPLSTCEDHVDVSSSQAATDHEGCDSSGELAIDEVECETNCADIDEDKSSNKLDDTFSNKPPADDIHQSSTDETSSDHGTLTKQKLPVPEGATGRPSQDGSLSSIAEQLEHDQSIPEETPLSICEDPSPAHTDNELDGTFANNPPADAVHQTSTVETSSDHGDLSKSKQPVPKEPVDTEEKHEGRKSGLLAEETSCTHIDEDKSPNPSNDTFANNLSTDDIHQSSTDEPSSDHGVLTKQKQSLPEEAAGEPSQDGSLSSIAEQLEHDQSIPEETPLSICEDPSTAQTEPGNHDSLRELVTDKIESSQDVSLSPLDEQPKGDRNVIEETPLSTCEDHIDVSSSQAATDHEGCDSSGELVIDEVECETSCADIDEDKSSNKLDDTFSNNPPADDIHQSSTDETSSDHGTLTKQKLPVPEGATGKPSQDCSLSSIAEQLEHDQSIPEETPLSICEDASPAHTDSGVDDSLGELVTDKHECETKHEHSQGVSGAGQKLNDQNSQCQESVDAKSHDFLSNKKTDLTEGEQDARELAVGMTRKTTESLSDEQTQETEQGARSEKCVEIGNNSKKEKLGGSGEREDTTTPEGDTGDGTDRINSCPIKKDLEQACESQPFDVDHIQSSFEDNVSQDNKIMEQPDEDACSSKEVHGSKETCETQPFDVDHFHFDKEGDSYQDVSTAKEHPDEHPSREQPLAENEKLTDDSREQTVTEVAHDQDSGLRDGVFHPESGARATFAKEDTANNAHGFVMLSPFTLTREEFDAQDKSPDLKKSNVQASIKSAKQMCDAVQTTAAGREDTSIAIGEHQSSGSSKVAQGQSRETSYLEAGDMNMMKSPEKETDVAETEDDVCQAGEEVQTGGDDEKTADNNSEDKPPQQELKLKSPEKGRISIGYSKRKDKFKCFLCDEIGSGGSFEEHVMQHLLWKPYKCLYCSQYFITRSDIGKHVSESHNGKQLRCGLRAIKKAKECMREAQRKGTCMYFADKLNGMYWSCKKKKTDHEAKLLDEKAEGTSGMSPHGTEESVQGTEESVQGTEESVQGTKQVPEPGFDQSDQAEVNQISMDRVLDQGNVIQPRSSDFSTSFNMSETAMVNQGGESRNSMPDVIFTKQLVKPRDGDTVLATTNLGTVSASATATATATVPQTVAATITAQVQAAIPAATQAAIPAQALTTVQPITSPVHNSLQSIMPGTISPQSMNVQVIQSSGLTVPAIPVFLNHISGGVKTPVVSDASNTGFTSVLTSPPASNSVVQQLTLSPPKIMPRSHIISSDPNKIILGNPATVPVNQGQQSNMQPILIPVSLNTNVNQFGVTSVSSKASSKGERADREIQPVKGRGSPDGYTKSKDKQLKFHDITQAFKPPSANITILPRPPTAVKHLPLLTSFFLPSQQSSSSAPQVLNSTAASGFIPQNVSIVNPNCPVLVIQKAGYGPFMQLKSSNQTAPVESQILTHPKRQNPSEVEHAVSSKNIPPGEGQKQTLTSGSYVYKPQPSDQSKRVCVMFTVGLVNGVFVCAMCRGRFKHENSFRAHLWNHIHDANMPCPHCKSSTVSGLNILACSKTDGYMENLKTGLVGNSSYLEIKGYRTVSNTVDSQLPNTQNEPNKAQKYQVDKSKHSQGIIDISSEVVSRDPVQTAIVPEARPKGLAPTIHGDEATAKTGVEDHSVTLATGVPDQYVTGVASGTGEPSFKEQQSSNNDGLVKSTAAPDLEDDLPRVKITSRTVSSVKSVGADNTEGHLPSITPNQDSDKKSKGVAKPVSSDRGDHTTGDAKDSQKLAPGSEKDLNRNPPSPVKVTTTWTFYVCGSQCGYSSLYAQEFKKHVAECNRSGSLLCSHCQYSSDGPESLLRHIVKHYVGHAPGIAVHTCSISGCRFTTNILQGYYQHLASNHTEVKEYECNYCNDVFSDLVSFMKHLQENVLHVVSCRYCSARDCAKTVLVKHIMEAHPGKSRMTNMLKQLVCKDRKDNHALSLLSPKSSSASKPAIGASTAPAAEALPPVLGDDGRVDQNIVLEIDRAASPALAENTDAHLSCNETGDETSLGGSVKDASLDPVFRCSVCTYIGVDRHDLNTHIAKHDDKTSKTAMAFSCTECPDGFNFLANFEIHLRRHSKLLTYNLYVCSVCKYEVGSNDVMLNHMAQIHKLTGKGQTQFSRKLKVSKTDVLNCSSCPFQCLDQNVLDVHRQKRHLSSTNKTPEQVSKDASLSNTSSNEDQVSANNKSAEKGDKPTDGHGKGKLKMTIPHNSVFISPVRCISCKFSSVYKANIQRHMDKHHPEIELVVESGKIGSPLKKVVTDEAPVKLEPNDMRLQIGSTLLDTELQWLYEGHGSSYRCMICSKSLYKRNYLHGHILDHLDISLWKCKECDFKSSRRNVVKDHMKDIHEKKCHTEEVVPVVDEIRPKIFKVLGKLIQDDKLVTDVKPSLGSKELDEKLKYMYKVIGKQKICKRCETEHQSLYSMHSHIMRRHFGLHLFKCCYCDFSGLERYVVAKHSKEKHPDEELSVGYHPNNIKDMVSDEDKKRTERSHQSTTKSSSSDHSSSHERRTELRVGSDILDQKLQPMYHVRFGKTRKLICRSCQADYPSKYSLHCHLLKHLKINLVACPHCDFELLEQSKMGDHIKVVHPRSHIYFKFLDVDIGSAVQDYLEKKDAQAKTDRKNTPKAAKPKLSDLLAKRKPASPIKHTRSPEKVSKNVMSITAGGLKRFKCRLCDYMALTKHSVGTHVFKVHKNSGTKTTTITDASRSLVPDYFLCKFCKFKTHLLELLKSHYTRKHPLETMDEPVAVPENTIESGDEGGDGYEDDDDFTPDSLQHFSSLFAEKETCQNEEGNKNSENAHPETPKEEDKQKRESPVTFEEARVVLEKIDAGDKAVSDISERVKLKKRKEKCYEEDAEGQPAKKMKGQDTEHSQVSYTCPKCSYVDSSKTQGVLHLKKIHNVNKLMQCAYCTASYITEDTLKNHIRFLHKGKEILHQEIPLESMLAEVTSSHPSPEVSPRVGESPSSGKSADAPQNKPALPGGSSGFDKAPKPTKSSKSLKDQLSPESKESKKIDHRAEASNISSKDSSKDVSKDSKHAPKVDHEPEQQRSKYASFVPSSPDNSDHEERVYYKYVCVYCDVNINSNSEIKTHLAKHCLERLHGNKIPESEEARLKIKKKVRDIIPICVERASNKKVKVTSQPETIEPEASRAASEAETERQSTEPLKNDVEFENKVAKHKKDVQSESDSDSEFLTRPVKKCRRRIRAVISSSDEDEPIVARKEERVNRTSTHRRIYCCHLCRYKVGSLYKFRSHLASHGNFKYLNPDMSLGLVLKCGFCGFQAKDKDSFSQHVEEHLDGRIYKCGYCKYDSYHSKNMRSHLKNKHRHKPEKIIDLRISMNERARRPAARAELVNLDPIVMLEDVIMNKDFPRLLKELGVRTLDMDENMKDVILGQPGQKIEVRDMELEDSTDEEDSNSEMECRVDDDVGYMISSEGSDVPLGEVDIEDVSDEDLYRLAPPPTD